LITRPAGLTSSSERSLLAVCVTRVAADTPVTLPDWIFLPFFGTGTLKTAAVAE
jgi:hypothetical protein